MRLRPHLGMSLFPPMRFLLPLLAVIAAFAAEAPAPLRVFIRSGPKTHGPGDHDHPAFLRDWVPLLNLQGAKATGSDDFPTAEQLAQTDVLIIHRQGGGAFKPAERELISAYAQRGGGLVVIHAGAVAGGSGASTDFYRDLVGGSWRQKVTKWREGPMQLDFVDKTHAISRDINGITMKDEIYYDMDLRADIRVLATAPTPKKTADGFEAQAQVWTYEKPGAQRAFVFIPGHTYANFGRPDVKRLLLRGIAWAARRDLETLTAMTTSEANLK